MTSVPLNEGRFVSSLDLNDQQFFS